MKKGTIITWTRRNGLTAFGKVTGTQEGGRGSYLLVDLTNGPGGKSFGKDPCKIRPTQAVVVGK